MWEYRRTIAALGISICAIGLFTQGCGKTRPEFTSVTAFDTAVNQRPALRAQIDPNGTTVFEILLEWGRRPPEQISNLIYTETVNPYEWFFTPAGLPRDEPFTVTYRFPADSEWAEPLGQGEVLDYQFRVKHTTDDGDLLTWSGKHSVTIGPPSFPPPPDDDDGPGGDDPTPIDTDPCDSSVCSGETQRVSVYTGSGAIPNPGGSVAPSISPECMVVAFTTPVGFDNSGDNNFADDVYVHDLVAGATEWVSVYTGNGSIPNNGGSFEPSISGDGNRIAFTTPVGFDNSQDTNDELDVYVHDRADNETRRVSVYTGNGSIPNPGGSREPAISANGRFVAFTTPIAFDNSGDNNFADDVYVHDIQENETFRVSVKTGSGSIDNTGGSRDPSISADGRYIAFATPVALDNSNDNNNADDIYVHDRIDNETFRVSVFTGGGGIANPGGSIHPSISGDGNRIAFETPVAFDNNQDGNNAVDIYVHDRDANNTFRVSIYTGGGSIGEPGGSVDPAISLDGNVVTFATPAAFDNNADNNSAFDVYVHNIVANQTRRVSIYTGGGSIGEPGGSHAPAIDSDGGVVAFQTPVGFDNGQDTNNEDDVYVNCGQ